MTNNLEENLHGKLSNMLLLMTLQFLSGYGNKLKKVSNLFYSILQIEFKILPLLVSSSKSLYFYPIHHLPFLILLDKFPPTFTIPLSLKSSLRYGENPHQKAAFYTDSSLSEFNGGGIATAIQHHGKVRETTYFFNVLLELFLVQLVYQITIFF